MTIGFQTCDKPNLDVTGVVVNGVMLDAGSYSWEGDDINIDFTNNTNTNLGLIDYDLDGFYDDLRGGDSLQAVVEIGVTCEVNENESDCAKHQLYKCPVLCRS